MQGATAQAVVLTKPSEREIVISRSFAAPRALVFKAWTQPEHIVRWWGPDGFRTTHCKIDLRPGGRYRMEMWSPEGEPCPTSGTYLEVVPPERLVCDEVFGCLQRPEIRSRVTVTFQESAGRTTVTIHTLCESRAHRDALIEVGVEWGWNQTLARLADHLPQMNGSN